MLKNIETYMKEKNFSGILFIKKNNKIIINECFGFRDKANKILNNHQTAFGIASGTKSFTALGILKLIEAGKLTLESKVFDIIDQPHDSYDKSVTIHQMLSHTSGLPDYYDEDLIEDFDNFTIETPWHLLKKPSDYFTCMPNRPMKHKPNTVFHYNNGAYVMLAMIIEKLTGDYHQYLNKEIFKPLNLLNTGFYSLDALPENTALGYIQTETTIGWKTNVYNLPVIGGGDGGLYTSSDDLLKIWDALLENKIVSHALTTLMLKPHSHEEDDSYYGYGIWLNKDDETFNPSMVGSDAGVSFTSFKDLERNVTVIAISNTSNGVWDILDDVEDLVKTL